MNRLNISWTVALLAVFPALGSAQALGATRLRVEEAVNPVGIDRADPRLSWQVAASQRGSDQAAYEIQVASSKANLEAGKATIWSTGRVASKDQIRHYAGPALRSAGQYYWRVRVWDAAGKVSRWSDISSWEMGLLAQADWAGARWIRVGGITTPEAAYAGHYLRKPFNVAAKVKSARLYVTATGMLQHCADNVFPQACKVAAGIVKATVNGKKAGDRELDPAPTYITRALYAVYDVTNDIRQGANVIGLTIAGDSDVIARLAIETADGRTQSVVTGTDWVTHPSPQTKADRFGGVQYDARLELPGWDTPEFAKTSDWSAAADATDKSGAITLSSSASLPPMRVVKKWTPVKITPKDSGEYVVDFGMNISGRVHFRLAGSPGQVVKFAHTENLNPTRVSGFGAGPTPTPGAGAPAGTARPAGAAPNAGGGQGANRPAGMANLPFRMGDTQTDEYTFGDKPADWTAEFAYYGFRWVTITGLKSAPQPQDIWAEQINSDLETTGSFTSSDPLFNKIHVGAVQTTLNNAHGIPEDCPHREKRGWSADGFVADPQAFANFDMKGFYEKWMQDLRDSQHPDGSFPDIAPAETGYMKKMPDSVWGQVGVELPWDMYHWTGDLDVLRTNYPAMVRYIDWTISQAKDFTLLSGSFGSDWAALKRTHDPLLRTAFWYRAVQIMIQTARLLDKQADVAKFTQLADNIQKTFNARFLDAATGMYGEPGNQATTLTQAAFGAPIAAGIVPAAAKDAVAKQFADYIVNVSKVHPESGLTATRYVLEAIDMIGRRDLLHTMAQQTDQPSWGYIVNTGPGTMWESWRGGSHNHAWTGIIDAYFYSMYGGISAVAPGFRTSEIRPYVPENIASTKASQGTPFGKISSEWQKQGGSLQWDVVIPSGTTSRIVIPVRSGSAVSLAADGQAAKDPAAVRGVKQVAKDASAVTYEVVSGSYRFQVTGY